MNNLVYVDTVVPSPLTLPRLSAKYGGHRTDTVGRSKNGKTIAILYNAYDAPSKMTADAASGAEDADVTAELEVMLAVGRALARLQNPAGRRRVLNWAVQRFEAAAAENLAASEALTSDPTLVVGDLSDFFGDRRSPAQRSSEGMDDRLDDLFDQPSVGLLAPTSHEEAPSTARYTPRLKLLVHHFVSALSTLRARCQLA